MNVTINAPKTVVANGAPFFELFLGVDVYSTARSGQTVTVTTNDGDVEATVQSVVMGPLAQFLSPGVPHVSNLGRAHDIRTVVDAIEDRYPPSKKANAKALDPRTPYTAVYMSVPYSLPTPLPLS